MQNRSQPLGGFTLLELILALALSSVVLLAVGMAVQVQIQSYDSRRSVLEESQLARSLLRIIADDIRRVVVDYEQDVSVVEQLIDKAKASAAGGGQGGGGQGEEGSGGSGGGESGQGGESQQGEQGGETSGGGSSGISGESTSNTEDLENATSLPSTPGIYGNQNQLQIDISRLPRIEEYQPLYTQGAAGELVDIPSDIKTVSYFVMETTDAATAARIDPLAAIQGDGRTTQGLVRRELDRAVTQWSLLNGASTAMMQSGDLLAPEVVGLQFQYFDGIQWLTEWDTEYQEALPLAIEVVLMMHSGLSDTGEVLQTSDIDEASVRYYRLVVHLPVGQPAALDESTTGTL